MHYKRMLDQTEFNFLVRELDSRSSFVCFLFSVFCPTVPARPPEGIKVAAEYSETLEKVSVSTTFAQSQLVSVSTTPKFQVSKSLGLDNSKTPGLKESQSRQLQNS